MCKLVINIQFKYQEIDKLYSNYLKIDYNHASNFSNSAMFILHVEDHNTNISSLIQIKKLTLADDETLLNDSNSNKIRTFFSILCLSLKLLHFILDISSKGEFWRTNSINLISDFNPRRMRISKIFRCLNCKEILS